MKVLRGVKPTAEQLPIISNPTAGVVLIRGAAGSGKTTTAMLMLKQLALFWSKRNQRMQLNQSVRILVLTFNRTLRGYISELAQGQIKQSNCSIEVSTFAKWAQTATGMHTIVNDTIRKRKIIKYGEKLGLDDQFLLSEADYLLGRFLPGNIDEYLDCERIGRGNSPRIDRARRKLLLNDVIRPYVTWKKDKGVNDWSDLAVSMINETTTVRYHSIIVDEAQDFSANEIRAVMSHAANLSTVVFVLDTFQRIYPRGCTWQETGVKINSNLSYRLRENYRNTKHKGGRWF